ncbi:hypothetical protein CAL7716_032200 [Calothrix sp. PCC 7716]|nr:hypothetical protein CAL7716_032200 [Calothrix sp. PCC 7716]
MTKRISIAAKLADMKVIQNLLISNEQQFIEDCTDDDIRGRLQHMQLKANRKNKWRLLILKPRGENF